MPFVRPTLADLVTRIRSDFRSRLSINGSLLRRAMADVLAVVWAGAAHLMHGHLQWLSKQVFPDESDRDFLLRQAGLYGITPNAASFAVGIVVATGTNGSVIPNGTLYSRDDGVEYEVTGDATIASGTANVSVECLTAGATGNMSSGDSLSLESPITGVNTAATVDTGGITDGTDTEDTDGTRARFILELQKPPEGGIATDYVEWALTVAGVTRVWPHRYENAAGTLNVLGTVSVYFVRDFDGSGSAILPSGGEITDVQNALNEQRPITAEVTAKAPTALTVNFTIHISPDTTDIRTAVGKELADLLVRDAAPGDGATSVGTILLSHIRTAIGVAEGVNDFTLTVPSADVVPTLGQLAIMGTVTWT